MRLAHRIINDEEILLNRILQSAFIAAAAVWMATAHAHEGKLSFAPVLKKVTPAVVNISVETKRQAVQNPLFNDPMFRRFFGIPDDPGPSERGQSVGSGVIIDAEAGHVVTNHHVIEGAETITVTMLDDRQFEAELIGSDEGTDVALLKIEAEDLTTIPFGDSEALEVGDFVLAIGNPFRLGHTVTSGIVSALGRGLTQDRYEDFIQTDASINPGNSGGALVDLDGRLVGINTMIYTSSGGNIGIGFAVPTRMVRGIVDQLIEYGEVSRGMLGVTIQDIPPDLAETFDLSDSQGALVSEVMPNSAAEEAGIEAGDVIISVNGEQVEGSSDLRNRIGLMRVGAELKLVVIRDGRRIKIDAEVGRTVLQQLAGSDTSPKLEGAMFGALSEANADLGEGVEVLSVQQYSRAWAAGLRPGDVVLSVNRMPVSDINEFNDLIEETDQTIALGVQRGYRQILVLVR